MSDQPSLFDLPDPEPAAPVRKVRVRPHYRTVKGAPSTGEQLAAEAAARAEANADEEWLAAARKATQIVAATMVTFTSEDVHAQMEDMGVETRDTRALGNVIRAAVRAGWCSSTDQFRAAKRPESHARPIRVWLSSICT